MCIDEADNVDRAVIEWLTVLSRRDIALLINVRTPDGADKPAGALLARFAEWWVVWNDQKSWFESVAPERRPPRARRTR